MNDIIVDVIKDTGNKIVVSQNDNLTKTYKLIVTKNNARYDLSNKKVRFAFLKNGTTFGDIVEELTISDPANGIVDFPITSTITRENGIFTCGLAIFDDGGYMENTAFFNMLVKESLFEKISGGLIDEGVYGQILSLLEKGEKLQKKLEPLVNRAEVITTKIEDLVPRAEAITQPLQNAVEDAETKKPQLDESIESAKKFIESLDGSQNLPQMREDITELQNGLKSNQELAYEGHDLKCKNTLDGRIEDIVLEGMIYQNLFDVNTVSSTISATVNKEIITINADIQSDPNPLVTYEKGNIKDNTKYTFVINVIENTLSEPSAFRILRGESYGVVEYLPERFETGLYAKTFTTNSSNAPNFTDSTSNFFIAKDITGYIKFTFMILEGDYTMPNSYIPPYFGGIKSVGEAEKNKINILSRGKNLCAYLESGGTNGGGDDFGGDYSSLAYMRSNYINVEGMEYLACNVTNDKNSSIRFNVYCFYDSEKKGIKPYSYSKMAKVPANAKYCRVEITTDGSKVDIDSYISTTKCIVIEGKSIPNTFEPYKEDKIEFKLPFEGGLKGLTNGVKDLIYNKDDGCYVLQKVGKKTVLGNGIDDYYELDVPIETKLSDIKLSLDTYSGLTYVFSNNTISPNIKLKVASNIGSIVQQNSKSVNDIYKLLYDVIMPQVIQNASDIATAKFK